MDELVRRAGFVKERTEVDQWGIFTVSVARRCEDIEDPHPASPTRD
jgi:hypothetical protein